ncbi:helix-turn-helix domain-containing protein [Achromobacter kerstersii]|jgi:HTH-type transcriptional regulator/antitoxin HipB|uniref:HTH cro/C1-type domain-containing protein n=1 Tax=Achromobacter kerstersii TaxID=1353890 RepID=A0A6S7AQL4_9BURK|nr:helix-turn-helix transcriptional regulator [Achromobacter kerstersii]CAB3738644.1 hypothetical protein LMG3441_05381 [Achromobacter kerstersii]
MSEFTVRTSDQLSGMLRAFRKQAGLTQGEVAERLGLRQQTYSTLERNAETVSAGRLMKVLAVLGVDLVLHQREPADSSGHGIADERDAGMGGHHASPKW